MYIFELKYASLIKMIILEEIFRWHLEAFASELFISSPGFFSVDTNEESSFVMEGDSVILHTGVETKQQEKIRWYFKDTRIAQITGDLSNICTDVQCNEGTERFRDRLKLDHQTGSLTITNIRTDSGEYQLRIITSSNISTKSFILAVYGESLCLRASRVLLSLVKLSTYRSFLHKHIYFRIGRFKYTVV